MQCKQCNRTFHSDEMVASISGSILGDEHIDSFYFCPTCQVYTVATLWDDFTGEETRSVSGPLSKREGDERVALIQRCPEPWDKKCRCAAHLTYFNNTLD